MKISPAFADIWISPILWCIDCGSVEHEWKIALSFHFWRDCIHTSLALQHQQAPILDASVDINFRAAVCILCCIVSEDQNRRSRKIYSSICTVHGSMVYM